MNTHIELGPFLIKEKIGEGGMGSVWSATHVETGVPVAIKVIRGATEDSARSPFRKEVQAHAALSHPGIVYLFDYGQIDESAAIAEGLQKGSPYVAMEFATDGTVYDAMPVDDWSTARAILVQTLDALAYAHARGVIHRDLKPENLLCFGDTDGSTKIKLADFGIAHALGREHETEVEELQLAAGTPRYSSPEQLRGHWREYGPWTDLYALGCMAFELVCGRPPFTGKTGLAVAMKHFAKARPPLQPRFAVPDELQDWIHRAMAIEPALRFRRAADALWVLPGDSGDHIVEKAADVDESIDPARPFLRTSTLITPPPSLFDDNGIPAMTESPNADSASSLSSITTLSRMKSETSTTKSHVGEPSDKARPDFVDLRPPLPERWRPEDSDPLPAPLIGAGLGLFGLREPPFVNRRHECHHTWAALRQVVDTGSPQLVLLRGEAGTGKSKLAEWLSTRAHEVGAATVLRVVHSHSGGPTDGLRAAFEQAFRTVKMSRGEVHEHLLEKLAQLSADNGDAGTVERDARALTEVLRPTGEDAVEVEGPRYRFSNATHRHTFAIRILRLLATDRPLLLWLDDLQWGSETFGMLEYLAETSSELPAMLLVATIRSDVVAGRSRLRERLEALEDADWCRSLTVDALDRPHQRELLEGLLPLQEELAESLARRTEGHPLFAMQLLSHWIDRGDIVSSPQGFRIPDGRDVELPQDIHELWMERITQLTQQYPAQVQSDLIEALELAAALGREVVAGEWRGLLIEAGIDAPADLVAHLVARGLGQRTVEGWYFAHGMLRESLHRHAETQNRWRRHHRRCARLLQNRDNERRSVAPRIARHLLVAEEYEEALDPLLDAVRHCRITHDIEEGHRFYESYRDAVQQLGIDDDRRAVTGQLEYATLYQREMRLQEAEEVLHQCHETCRRQGWNELLAKTLLSRAINARSRSHLDEAEKYARTALSLYRQLEDPEGISLSLKSLGSVYRWKSEFESAHRYLEQAERQLRDMDRPHEYAGCLFYLAEINVGLKNFDQAADYASRARSLYEELGDLRTVAYCLNSLGECNRFRGQLDRAARYYEEAIKLGGRLGRDRDVATHFNVGVVHMMRDDFRRALPFLDEALRRAKLEDRPGFLAIGHVGMLACMAGLGRFGDFDDHLCQVESNLERTTMAIRDIPLTCEIAADKAAEAGHPERARRALELAMRQWAAMENEQQLEAVNKKLQML